MSACLCICAPRARLVHAGDKSTSDSLELVSQVAVSCQVGTGN